MEHRAFELGSITKREVDGQSICKIAFKIKLGEHIQKDILGVFWNDGYIELLPKKSWVVLASEYCIQEPDEKGKNRIRRYRQEIKYDENAKCPVPVPKSVRAFTIDHNEHPDYPVKETIIDCKFRLLENKPSEEEFSPKRYGQPERMPEEVDEYQGKDVKSLPGYAYLKRESDFFYLPLWAWVTLVGVLLFLTGIVIRRFKGNPTACQEPSKN